jgi:hypothetical protein
MKIIPIQSLMYTTYHPMTKQYNPYLHSFVKKHRCRCYMIVLKSDLIFLKKNIYITSPKLYKNSFLETLVLKKNMEDFRFCSRITSNYKLFQECYHQNYLEFFLYDFYDKFYLFDVQCSFEEWPVFI